MKNRVIVLFAFCLGLSCTLAFTFEDNGIYYKSASCSEGTAAATNNGNSGTYSEKRNNKAKNKKIKYSKTIHYQGLAIDNIAMGKGCLVVKSAIKKKIGLKETDMVHISGNFIDGVVHDATIHVNGGITISTNSLTYRLNITKEVEELNLFMQNCKLTNREGLSITDIDNLELRCRRVVEKRSDIPNIPSAWQLPIRLEHRTKTGDITSNFLSISDVPSWIDANDVSKQKISFKLENREIYPKDDVLEVKATSLHEIVFNSGIIVKNELDNQGYIVYSKVILEGGTIATNSYGDIYHITYQNGDVFYPSDDKWIPKLKNRCKNVSEISVVNGQMSHPNGIKDTYSNGEIISTSYPLADGGSYVKMKNGHDKLLTPNGELFEAGAPDGLVAQKEYSASSRTTDYVMSNGIFTGVGGRKIVYNNGNVANNINNINAYVYNDSDRNHEIEHRLRDGSSKCDSFRKIKDLANGDIIGYFDIDNVKTDLQRKAFSQTDEYQSIYLPRLKAERSNLYQDKYIVKFPLEESMVFSFKYDVNLGRFVFQKKEGNSESANKGCSDFYFTRGDLCLSYPRSLVSSITCRRHDFADDLQYILNAQTCKVSESDALKVENNEKKCEIACIFKIEKVSNSYIYGKTIGIYIANKETGEIYCDLSKSLEARQGSFNSGKVIRKAAYHKNGRRKRCGACEYRYDRYCPWCFGKGWYIVHVW